MITRAKISAVRANSFVVLEQFIVFFLVIRNSSNKRRIGGAALNRVNTVTMYTLYVCVVYFLFRIYVETMLKLFLFLDTKNPIT